MSQLLLDQKHTYAKQNILSLPVELIASIASYLNCNDLWSLRRASKSCQSIFSSEHVSKKVYDNCWFEEELSFKDKDNSLISHSMGTVICQPDLRWYADVVDTNKHLPVDSMVLLGDRVAWTASSPFTGKEEDVLNIYDLKTKERTTLKIDSVSRHHSLELCGVFLTNNLVGTMIRGNPSRICYSIDGHIQHINLEEAFGRYTACVAAHNTTIAILIEEDQWIDGIWVLDVVQDHMFRRIEESQQISEFRTENTALYGLLFVKEWLVFTVTNNLIQIRRRTGMTELTCDLDFDLDPLRLEVRRVDDKRYHLRFASTDSELERHVIVDDHVEVFTGTGYAFWREAMYKSAEHGIRATSGSRKRHIETLEKVESSDTRSQPYQSLIAVNDKWMVRMSDDDDVVMSVFSTMLTPTERAAANRDGNVSNQRTVSNDAKQRHLRDV